MKPSDFLIVLGSPGGGPVYTILPTEDKMEAIKEATKFVGEMSGFTLFQVKDSQWQMSIRPANEPGWICQRIPEPEALAILAALEADKRFLSIDVTVGKLRNNSAERQQDLDNPTEATTRSIGDPVCRHGRSLLSYCPRCDEEDGMEGIPVGREMERLRALNIAAREELSAALAAWSAR